MHTLANASPCEEEIMHSLPWPLLDIQSYKTLKYMIGPMHQKLSLFHAYGIFHTRQTYKIKIHVRQKLRAHFEVWIRCVLALPTHTLSISF